MSELYEQTLHLSAPYINARGELRVSRLLEILQELSSQHMDLLHAGTAALTPHHMAWIIVRQHMEILRMPGCEETITLRTWVGKSRHGLYPRHYEVISQNGEYLVRGWALWSVMDLLSRTMLLPSESGITLPCTLTGRELPIAARIHPGELPQTFTFIVPYSYTDKNAHMNNTRYFDMAEDHLPHAFSHRLTAFSVEYRSEAVMGDTLTVCWGETGGTCTLRGTLNGDTCFLMQLQYE